MEAVLENPSKVDSAFLIETSVLKSIVSKAVKACSFIEAFPLTGLIQLKTITVSTIVNDQETTKKLLEVTTTDNVNVLRLYSEYNSGEIDALVDAKIFSALVAKLGCQFTKLWSENGNLKINANGNYELKIITEEDGSKITIDVPEFNFNVQKNNISALELKTILTTNKASKSETKDDPSLFNYYFDSKQVLTTDFYKVCSNPISLFSNPVCLAPEITELASLVCDEQKGVDSFENNDSVAFSSSLGTLYGKKAKQEDLEGFPVEPLSQLIEQPMEYKCVINRTNLADAIDRLCLFSTGFANNEINLEFYSDKIKVSSASSNNFEEINYTQVATNEQSIKIKVDGLLLKNQLTGSLMEEITVEYGSADTIKLVCGKTVQILSSMDDGE